MVGVSAERTRTYDIFEIIGDSPFWRAAIIGRDEAIEKAKEFGHETRNEIRVMNILDEAIVAVVNLKKADQ